MPSPSSTRPLRVAVVGAGFGGLCLAHHLKRSGIAVDVYECDRTRADGLHGYRVGIDPDGSRALKASLPPDLFATFAATCARAPRRMTMVTEKLGTLLDIPFDPGADPGEAEHSVSRMTLRQVLLTGLEDVVHFDKEFTHYERHDDATVTAHFADGTHANADLLVAADGANSRVRAQYLPHARVTDCGIVGLTAKAPLTARTRSLVPAHVAEGVGLIVAPRGFNGILHTMEFNWDRDGVVKNGIGGNDAELIARWPGLLYDNTRDYINWGIWAATDKFPPDVRRLRGQDVVDLALRLTPHWHPDLRTLMTLSDSSSAFPLVIRTSEPVAPWKPGNVTLLGDAIHTMTPGMGVGANTALRDAVLLGRNLADHHAGRRTLLDAVGDYEERMRDYAYPAVLASRERMTGDAIVHKPVVGALALVGQRTMLRAVNRFPALKRKFTERMADSRGAGREG
ncbi:MULTISPECIES: FAD-dependent oxidoreductase [Streptomycetaceae]|uniref:Putative FAD-depending monooxygenase n=1 Tax=Streptantibioticus cattleyicolor (strain ATCC 35852 / DSM 46488 / JCM 4925 / NBRC 14057 / NRRL 8057) TaxID=1003195 RepID=F8K346_STREN|nr:MULTISPECIES: NAD(P)/FAD-dependent oxidoreductase [Streptomycetaceae]AEW93757.1 putative FAD-depending monooxygenase [Streptantibioticus cattleyicolor NRRL 8057 = DSM 46488]MYS58446.1 NAD(P)-binding protein [Streptomyces sp. SID5468]CCB74105.1 putative FAD-depending monooxygenase [Streptantibioticus cattleyicolor NRRL 8057 = DSM 46488]